MRRFRGTGVGVLINRMKPKRPKISPGLQGNAPRIRVCRESLLAVLPARVSWHAFKFRNIPKFEASSCEIPEPPPDLPKCRHPRPLRRSKAPLRHPKSPTNRGCGMASQPWNVPFSSSGPLCSNPASLYSLSGLGASEVPKP